MDSNKLPLIVIVGPTASGKTALAIKLAEKFDGEIICADSRTVYRGLDIGTAKPTTNEQKQVPHWGIDLVNPDERYSAADFKKYANKKIQEIRARGRIPFLVGGTGLYINAVLYDYSFVEVDQRERERLDKMTLEELWKRCEDDNVLLPENYKNKLHVVQALLRKSISGKSNDDLPKNTIVVGITTDKQVLKTRIEKRAKEMFTTGVVEETMKAANLYGWNAPGMTGNIYRIVKLLNAQSITLEGAIEQFSQLDKQLAKRQMTWFKRDEHILWYSLDDAYAFLVTLLARNEQ